MSVPPRFDGMGTALNEIQNSELSIYGEKPNAYYCLTMSAGGDTDTVHYIKKGFGTGTDSLLNSKCFILTRTTGDGPAVFKLAAQSAVQEGLWMDVGDEPAPSLYNFNLDIEAIPLEESPGTRSMLEAPGEAVLFLPQIPTVLESLRSLQLSDPALQSNILPIYGLNTPDPWELDSQSEHAVIGILTRNLHTANETRVLAEVTREVLLSPQGLIDDHQYSGDYDTLIGSSSDTAPPEICLEDDLTDALAVVYPFAVIESQMVSQSLLDQLKESFTDNLHGSTMSPLTAAGFPVQPSYREDVASVRFEGRFLSQKLGNRLSIGSGSRIGQHILELVYSTEAGLEELKSMDLNQPVYLDIDREVESTFEHLRYQMMVVPSLADLKFGIYERNGSRSWPVSACKGTLRQHNITIPVMARMDLILRVVPSGATEKR